MLGFEFATSEAIDVTELGWWVSGANSQQVGIWTSSGTTPLVLNQA